MSLKKSLAFSLALLITLGPLYGVDNVRNITEDRMGFIPKYIQPEPPATDTVQDEEIITADYGINVGMLRRALWYNSIFPVQVNYIHDLTDTGNRAITYGISLEALVREQQKKITYLGILVGVCVGGMAAATVVAILK